MAISDRSADADVTHLYIKFEDFLGAAQLSEVLERVDEMYNILYLTLRQEHPRPLQLAERLRIREIHTGQSIKLELGEGVSLSIKGPGVEVLSKVGAAAAIAFVLIQCAQGVVAMREQWYDGTLKKQEVEEVRGADESRVVSGHTFADVPPEAMRAVAECGSRLLHMCEYDSNIREVRVNGTTVVSKGAD